MRNIRRIFFVTLFFLLSTIVVFAQHVGEVVVFNWQEIAAVTINSVGVLVAVRLLNGLLPRMTGGLKQTIALIIGPLLMLAQTALINAFGYPIDLTPIAAVFTGAGTAFAAMGMFDVGKKLVR